MAKEDKLRCGQCGKRNHRVSKIKDKLILTCSSCKSQSEVYLPKVELRISNYSGLGTICKF